MRLIEFLRDFVKKEDPILWLSLFVASIVTFLFYLFTVFYVNFINR